MSIEKIDRNLEIKRTVTEPDVVWHNVTEEVFDIYGLCDPKNGRPFIRLPEEVGANVNQGVSGLLHHTAGGRIRFRTDSPYIALRVTYRMLGKMSHMTLAGQAGFDAYTYKDGQYSFFKNAMPTYDDDHGYERVFGKKNKGMNDFVIHMPLYNGVNELYIGVAEGSRLEHGSLYRDIKPVAYYGSSITQGGCASRPGNAYENMISMMYDIDHINLGFSGNCRGELAMADYIASLDLSVFVLDYDHNAPSDEHLEQTHFAFYERYRSLKPDTPIVIVSAPDVSPTGKRRRTEIIRETYEKAVALGDKKVSFVDGATLFGDDLRESCTVDGCHPNDLGFYRMAKGIGAAVAEWLK